jgi:hypothetical protein
MTMPVRRLMITGLCSLLLVGCVSKSQPAPAPVTQTPPPVTQTPAPVTQTPPPVTQTPPAPPQDPVDIVCDTQLQPSLRLQAVQKIAWAYLREGVTLEAAIQNFRHAYRAVTPCITLTALQEFQGVLIQGAGQPEGVPATLGWFRDGKWTYYPVVIEGSAWIDRGTARLFEVGNDGRIKLTVEGNMRIYSGQTDPETGIVQLRIQ